VKNIAMHKQFRLWKWKALQNRRLLFFSFLQLVLGLCWFMVYQSLYLKAFMIPILLALFHAVLLCLNLFIPRFSEIMKSESQGRRICDINAISLLAVLFFLNPPYLIKSRHDYIDDTTRGIITSTLSVFGFMIFHHLGVDRVIIKVVILIVFFMMKQVSTLVKQVSSLINIIFMYNKLILN
jgi:hypothetical protein